MAILHERCCAIGALHEGDPMGEVINVASIPTYMTRPKSGQTKHAVLFLTDIIGLEFINAQLIADQFAANGWLCVMPDLFEGDPVKLNPEPGFNIREWLLTGGPSNGHTTKQVDPIVEAVIHELRHVWVVEKIAAVGYCFGAKYVMRFMAAGKGIDVGAVAHPSFVEAEEVKGMVGPVTFAAAENDFIFPADKRRETEDVLREMDIPYQMSLYGNVEHGYATRGDIGKPEVKFAKEATFLQFVQWFQTYLA